MRQKRKLNGVGLIRDGCLKMIHLPTWKFRQAPEPLTNQKSVKQKILNRKEHVDNESPETMRGLGTITSKCGHQEIVPVVVDIDEHKK